MEEHGHYTYENETAADARSYACEWEDTPQGNRVTGVIGAMLGAMIGAIPWFIASTFTSNFIGWLGFLTGIAACYGYRLFRGRRSTRFAMTVIVISSILVLFAAEIASWMYVLCSDPDWQKDAALIGIPVARLAWESIRMPDNWHIMAPNMLIGMTIGLLGVVSARRRVLAYTDPDRAVRTAYTTAASQTAQANEAAGFAVPQSFTVEERKGVKITLRITGAMFILVSLVLLIGSVMESAAVGLDGESAAVLAVSFLVLLCAGICLPFLARRKMEVEGSVILCRPAFGRARTFQISEIAGMRSRFNNRQLIGRDGAVLARFEDNQKNGAILLQYLSEHGVGLLAE
jgi:hypothetical protein